MRNSLGAPHSTERCQVSKNIWNTQINAINSLVESHKFAMKFAGAALVAVRNEIAKVNSLFEGKER